MKVIIETLRIIVVVSFLFLCLQTHLSRTGAGENRDFIEEEIETIEPPKLATKAAIIAAPKINQPPKKETEKPSKKDLNKTFTIEFNPYVLFFLCLLGAGFIWWWQDWIKNRQQRVDERIFYTNRREPIIEASRTPDDKGVRRRAERHRQLLKKYGNENVEVFEVIYGSDPDYLGESFSRFQIRLGQIIAKVFGDAIKKKMKQNPEEFYTHFMGQDNPDEWKVNYK